MTNEELLTDLKQFIEATVSQQVAHVAEDVTGLRAEFKAEMQGVRNDIRLLDEKLDTIHDADTVQDHEQRLRRLEQRAV